MNGDGRADCVTLKTVDGLSGRVMVSYTRADGGGTGWRKHLGTKTVSIHDLQFPDVNGDGMDGIAVVKTVDGRPGRVMVSFSKPGGDGTGWKPHLGDAELLNHNLRFDDSADRPSPGTIANKDGSLVWDEIPGHVRPGSDWEWRGQEGSPVDRLYSHWEGQRAPRPLLLAMSDLPRWQTGQRHPVFWTFMTGQNERQWVAAPGYQLRKKEGRDRGFLSHIEVSKCEAKFAMDAVKASRANRGHL